MNVSSVRLKTKSRNDLEILNCIIAIKKSSVAAAGEKQRPVTAVCHGGSRTQSHPCTPRFHCDVPAASHARNANRMLIDRTLDPSHHPTQTHARHARLDALRYNMTLLTDWASSECCMRLHAGLSAMADPMGPTADGFETLPMDLNSRMDPTTSQMKTRMKMKMKTSHPKIPRVSPAKAGRFASSASARRASSAPAAANGLGSALSASGADAMWIDVSVVSLEP